MQVLFLSETINGKDTREMWFAQEIKCNCKNYLSIYLFISKLMNALCVHFLIFLNQSIEM